GFPGNGLRWYLLLCVAFFAAMLSAILVLAKEKKGAEAAGAAGGEVSQTATPSPPAAKGGDATAGKAVFTSSGCAACHTFTPAAAAGKVGPDLDKLPDYAKTANKPLPDFIRESITDPNAYVEKGFAPGVMPKDGGASLTPKQLDDLVAFLAQGK